MTRVRTGKYAAGRWRLATDDQGYSLAEVLVAIAVFTVISITAMYGLITLIKGTAATEKRVAASNLARQEIEQLRAQANTGTQLDRSPANVTLHNTVFTVIPTYSPGQLASVAPTATTTPPNPCPVGSQRAVSVTVNWNDSGNRSVHFDTVLSC